MVSWKLASYPKTLFHTAPGSCSGRCSEVPRNKCHSTVCLDLSSEKRRLKKSLVENLQKHGTVTLHSWYLPEVQWVAQSYTHATLFQHQETKESCGEDKSAHCH